MTDKDLDIWENYIKDHEEVVYDYHLVDEDTSQPLTLDNYIKDLYSAAEEGAFGTVREVVNTLRSHNDLSDSWSKKELEVRSDLIWKIKVPANIVDRAFLS